MRFCDEFWVFLPLNVWKYPDLMSHISFVHILLICIALIERYLDFFLCETFHPSLIFISWLVIHSKSSQFLEQNNGGIVFTMKHVYSDVREMMHPNFLLSIVFIKSSEALL